MMRAKTSLAGWSPSQARTFAFVDRSLSVAERSISLRYRLDAFWFTETIVFPFIADGAIEAHRGSIEAALDALHWIAGVSYWKAACPPELTFRDRLPDQQQAAMLNRLWQGGLAEFAWHNRLDTAVWPRFVGGGKSADSSEMGPLRRRSLVPMGGGKDSLVAWARLARLGRPADSVQIGSSTLIARLGEQLPSEHWQIERRIDPLLIELNQNGALNGHVPVTAINSAILVLAALLMDYDQVVFANERSADEATLTNAQGQAVNHQFSKSFEFECLFDDWVRHYIHPGLAVFSLLRRDRELAICSEFAQLTEFHPLFSSCNRNFHLDGPRGDRWCGQCPKCHFVFLALAPFLPRDQLLAIFGHDLLDDPAQQAGFRALLALDGQKPFECVGEAAEARSAVMALANSAEWASCSGLPPLIDALAGLSVSALSALCQPSGPHRIPKDLLDASG